MLRWSFADGDFLGDESWYFYLARTFGSEPAAARDAPWFHLLNRPLFYAIFHACTYGGLLGFRLFATAVGALVPVLAYRAATALGAGRTSALLLTAALCLHRQHVEHAAHGFPDLLAADFALGALWAVGRNRAGASSLLAIACVLCKESFIAVPAIVTWLRLCPTDPPSLRASWSARDRWAWLTLALPTSYVLAITALGLSVPGVSMQGWSATALTLKHARNMWVGPELWPFFAWLAWQRQLRSLVVWLGLPAFYLLWSGALGRGLAPWYVVGPSSLAAVAAAMGLTTLARRMQQVSRRSRVLAVGALLACLAPVPVQGALRTAAQLRSLRRLPQPTAAAALQPILARHAPERLLLVDCFWSFGYSHLRAAHGPPSRIYWWAGEAEVARAAVAADVTIVCREPEHTAQVARLVSQGFEQIMSDDRWLVITPRAPSHVGTHP
ncbi:MAG: hypothetical protein ABW321_32645 [Polyangiales bacterium]